MYAACEIASPATGPWSVTVSRYVGTSDYQMTTTLLEEPASVCGNGVVEAGEEYDVSADAACPGHGAPSCTCGPVCSAGDLATTTITSTARTFRYKARLFDPVLAYANLDPTRGAALDVSDGRHTVRLAIAGGDTAEGSRRLPAVAACGRERTPPTASPRWSSCARPRPAVPGGRCSSWAGPLRARRSRSGDCR